MADSNAVSPGARTNSSAWRRLLPWLTMALVAVAMVVTLLLMGRKWWCDCGEFYPWSGKVISRHNSQHLFDPYSFTHVLHGVLWCGLLAWWFRRLPVLWGMTISVAVSALWEVVENTDFVIQRFRESTMSLDYYGDTIFNALGDVLSCGMGFALARRLGLWLSVGLFVGIELLLLVLMRDNLTLNVLMLLFPVEAIKNWQLGK
jgi:Protein of unknown function (DUF2585)